MITALLVFGVLVAIVIIALAIGASLPREHVATVKARYAANPAAVWAVIGNPLAASSWRKDVKKIETLPDRDGNKTWKEHSSSGAVTFVLTESIAERRMVTRIGDDSLPFGGQWEFDLQPTGTGSELTISEHGFVKPAFFRLMARFVFGYTGAMEAYLTALGAKLGERVSPTIVAAGH